jgi:hypothetical protein
MHNTQNFLSVDILVHLEKFPSFYKMYTYTSILGASKFAKQLNGAMSTDARKF